MKDPISDYFGFRHFATCLTTNNELIIGYRNVIPEFFHCCLVMSVILSGEDYLDHTISECHDFCHGVLQVFCSAVYILFWSVEISDNSLRNQK